MMRILKTCLASLAMAGFLLWGLSAAPAGGQDEKKPAKGKVIETKGEPGKLAAKVDFSNFGLSLAGLSTLGARIDQARTAADPVALTLLAKELSLAETLSKKQADINAHTVFEEAVQLAKLRQNHDELRAVALLVPGKDVRAELAERAAKVSKDVENRKNGERSRGIGGSLHADSRVLLYIDVYVNGVYRGTVPPFGDIFNIFVGDPAGLDTFLYARAPGTNTTWGPVRVTGPVGNYTWILQ